MHKILLTITLFLVFGTSAYISISALFAVFPDAGIIIILMGVGMEVSKLLLVIHLHRCFNILSWISKAFYMVVIACLVLLTSAEVLGFLSMSHTQGSLGLKSNSVALDALEQEESILRDRISTIDETLSELPGSYVSKRLRERENAGYRALQERLIKVIRNKSVILSEKIENKSYSAPIFAVGRLLGASPDKVGIIFIIFLVCILEPLGIGLAIATSASWLPRENQVVTNVTEEQTHEITDTPEELENLKKPHVSDPVAESIIKLVDNGGFSGTMTELLAELNKAGSNGLPEDVHMFGKKLRSLEPELLERGIYVDKNRTMEKRTIELGRVVMT